MDGRSKDRLASSALPLPGGTKSQPGDGVTSGDSQVRLPPEVARQLRDARFAYVATVGRDCGPQLAPMWFVWHADAIWICTATASAKAVNLAADPRAVVGLDDPTSPVVVRAAEVGREPPAHQPVASAFRAKYAWELEALSTTHTLIGMRITRLVMGPREDDGNGLGRRVARPGPGSGAVAAQRPRRQ